MNIAIVSESIILTKGLSYILQDYTYIENIIEINTVKQINDIDEIDIVVVDMMTISPNFINDIKLKGKKILVISMKEDKEELNYVINTGINGYVVCKDDYEQIVFALKSILRGKTYYDGTMVSYLIQNNNNIEIDVHSKDLLTKRENELLIELGTGKSNKEIAVSLNISENTVKKHLRNIFDKLNLADRTQAALYCHNTTKLIRKSI